VTRTVASGAQNSICRVCSNAAGERRGRAGRTHDRQTGRGSTHLEAQAWLRLSREALQASWQSRRRQLLAPYCYIDVNVL